MEIFIHPSMMDLSGPSLCCKVLFIGEKDANEGHLGPPKKTFLGLEREREVEWHSSVP
jgi:hypothetical protein